MKRTNSWKMMRGARELLFGFCLSTAVWLGVEGSVFQTHSGSQESPLYVDQATGSDSNPGTQSRPVKTIGKAAQIAQDNYRKAVSTRVIIEPGTYRESISLSGEGASGSASITFDAAQPR